MSAWNVIPCGRVSALTSAASSKLSGRTPTIRSRGALARSSARRSRSVSGISPSGVRSVPSSTVAGTKFIAGEPMKPATNRLSGRS